MTQDQFAIVQRINDACDNRILTDEMNNPVTVGTEGMSLSSVQQDAIAWRLMVEMANSKREPAIARENEFPHWNCSDWSVGDVEDGPNDTLYRKSPFEAVLSMAERVLLK